VVGTVTPSEALQHIVTLVETSAALKDDTQRKVLLRGVVVVAQKGLGVAPDGVAECKPNVLTFPTRSQMSLSDLHWSLAFPTDDLWLPGSRWAQALDVRSETPCGRQSSIAPSPKVPNIRQRRVTSRKFDGLRVPNF
jgi:hypothetical protein